MQCGQLFEIGVPRDYHEAIVPCVFPDRSVAGMFEANQADLRGTGIVALQKRCDPTRKILVEQ